MIVYRIKFEYFSNVSWSLSYVEIIAASKYSLIKSFIETVCHGKYIRDFYRISIRKTDKEIMKELWKKIKIQEITLPLITEVQDDE